MADGGRASPKGEAKGEKGKREKELPAPRRTSHFPRHCRDSGYLAFDFLNSWRPRWVATTTVSPFASILTQRMSRLLRVGPR